MNAFLAKLNERRQTKLQTLQREMADLIDLLEVAGEEAPDAAAVKKAETLLEATGRTTADVEAALELRRRRRELEKELAAKPAIQQRFAELGEELQRLADDRPLAKTDISQRLEKAKARAKEARAAQRAGDAGVAIADVDLAVDGVREIEVELEREEEFFQRRGGELRHRRGELQQRLRDLAESQLELNRVLAAEQAALPALG